MLTQHQFVPDPPMRVIIDQHQMKSPDGAGPVGDTAGWRDRCRQASDAADAGTGTGFRKGKVTRGFQFSQRAQAATHLRVPTTIVKGKLVTGLARQCGAMRYIALRELISNPGDCCGLPQGPLDLILYIHATTLADDG
jgi:hypothetical protein